MAKVWTEPLDPSRHVDHFHYGGAAPRQRVHGLELAYFVRVAGFTFEFASVDQIRECYQWFSIRIHPSSRAHVFEPEKGEWQPWHSRLPAHIKTSSKRDRVLKAMRRAIATFA